MRPSDLPADPLRPAPAPSDIPTVLRALCTLCGRAIAGEIPPEQARSELYRQLEALTLACRRAHSTPIRQADLLRLAGALGRTVLLALRLPDRAGKRRELCDLARTLTELELRELFAPAAGGAGTLPDLLALYGETLDDPPLWALFDALCDLHLATAAIRLYL